MPNPFAEKVASPFISFRFEVLLNLKEPIEGISNPVCNASFAECSGLEMNMQPHTINEGGANQQKTHLKNMVEYGQLSLNRGMTSNQHLWFWFEAAATPGVNARADGIVTMFNPNGSVALVFKLYDCLPVSLTGPSLNASSSEVAIEEMQLTYARLKLESARGIGVGGASSSNNLSVNGGPGLNARTRFIL